MLKGQSGNLISPTISYVIPMYCAAVPLHLHSSQPLGSKSALFTPTCNTGYIHWKPFYKLPSRKPSPFRLLQQRQTVNFCSFRPESLKSETATIRNPSDVIPDGFHASRSYCCQGAFINILKSPWREILSRILTFVRQVSGTWAYEGFRVPGSRDLGSWGLGASGFLRALVSGLLKSRKLNRVMGLGFRV